MTIHTPSAGSLASPGASRPTNERALLPTSPAPPRMGSWPAGVRRVKGWLDAFAGSLRERAAADPHAAPPPREVPHAGMQRFGELADTFDDVFWIYEPGHAEFVYVSRSFESAWGVRRDALYRDAATWLQGVHPDDGAALASAIAGLADDVVYVREYRRTTRRGESRWIEETVRLMDARVARTASHRGARYAGVSRDVTAQHAREDALRAADRRKDDLLAVVSHELRDPLSAVAIASELMNRLLRRPGGEGLAAERRAAASIAHQARQMKRLVDDLLDVARIGSGKLSIESRQLSLGPWLSACVSACTEDFPARGLSLSFRQPSHELWVKADPDRLEQVLGNLVRNAANFSPDGGRIDVSLEVANASEVLIRVRDQGSGIAPADLDRIFDRFAQAPRLPGAAIGAGAEGLGLGLWIVRELVSLHDGRVDVHSDGPGHGAEFVVHLPAIAPSGRGLPALHQEAACLAAAGHGARPALASVSND